MRVGIAGLGKMGAAIAARLMECGHEVDRLEPQRRQGEAAGRGRRESRSVARRSRRASRSDRHHPHRRRSDRCGLSRPVRASVRRREGQAVHRDEHGAARRPRSRSPKRCAARARPLSNARSAAPPVRRGRASCSALPAAPKPMSSARKPLLDQMCRRVEHVGDVGAGAGMKLAINLPLMIYWQALGEALAISRHLNIDPARMMDILADTSGASTAVKNRGPNIATWLGGRRFRRGHLQSRRCAQGHPHHDRGRARRRASTCR